MLPSAAEVVAKFLRTNGYNETLASFIKEAGLAPDVGTASSNITIEQVLEEKQKFDLSLNFEKLGLEQSHGWTEPEPRTSNVVTTLPTESNILSVHSIHVVLEVATGPKHCVAVTTADRKLHLIDPATPDLSLLKTYSDFQDSPLLDLIVLEQRYLLVASMSGKMTVFDASQDRVVDERRDHKKYVVKIIAWPEEHSTIIASAGWDSKVLLYRFKTGSGIDTKIGDPFATINLTSIPECITFIPAVDTSLPILLVTRRDSTFLHYYSIPAATTDAEVCFLGRQNLAPHSNAWVAFTPSDVQICPTDPSLAAIATSSTPHMKLIVVRLLVPPSSKAMPDLSTDLDAATTQRTGLDSSQSLTQAALARAELATQNREEAAITINCNTMATQTAYSTPKLVWRPDGSGIYVNSDDGIVRGFEATTGKLMASLKAHGAGSKVRCLVAIPPNLNEDATKELLVSGGFDQKLIVWNSN
ncbi:WD40 repeat-like protein [Aaosphaeria arxii CBS 175.79]|uniref:WD40 repeat-like protein n=1 Tax=Aaosphaeria arxii CBS 175.79 TaxID=1450172 RepID=A0A6A5Y954_9PLEO|nr:WD40 repeat-like protein [Aaosphaeria arxii CBS 175.79]KAF2022132.1 WD40 repeat-like protein [Aaosphaeria arxii CBS 175.79]